jgi:hypothetical protein
MQKELIDSLLKIRTQGIGSVSESIRNNLEQLGLLLNGSFTEVAVKLMDATAWWRDRQNIKHLTNCVGGNYILIQNNTVIDYAPSVNELCTRHPNSQVTMIWVPEPH